MDMIVLEGFCSPCFAESPLVQGKQTSVTMLMAKATPGPTMQLSTDSLNFWHRHMAQSSMRLWGMCGSVP